MKHSILSKSMYSIVIAFSLFQSHYTIGGFGKGFGAGIGTFLGVSMLSNAIAQSNQPRVVYINPPQQRQIVYDATTLRPQFNRPSNEQNSPESNDTLQIRYLEQENQKKALQLQEEKLRLKAKELAIQEAQLRAE